MREREREDLRVSNVTEDLKLASCSAVVCNDSTQLVVAVLTSSGSYVHTKHKHKQFLTS